jgi:hypothetical protein
MKYKWSLKMKKYSVSLAIKEMQTKMALKTSLKSEWLSSITQTITNAGKDTRKKETYTLLMGTSNHYGK